MRQGTTGEHALGHSLADELHSSGLRRLACRGLNNTNQLGDDDPGDGVSLSWSDRLELQFHETE